MPDTTVKLQDITPVKSTFDNDDQLLLINPTGEARISKEDFLDAMPDDAITLIGDITTTGIEGDTVAKQLGALENSKASAITDTATGAIANFPDGADDLVMHNIVAEINPMQDLSNGDPSPSNICPISGWTGCNVTRVGKNLCPPNIEQGAFNDNGLNDLPTTATHATRVRTTDYIPVLGGKTITVSASGSAAYYTISGYTTNDYTTARVTSSTWIALGTSYTLGTNVKYIRIAFRNAPNSAITPSEISNVMCQYGGTASTFEPYINPATMSLSWQTEAGTVYGGTIDVATGLLTVDRAMVDMGALTWTATSLERWQSNGLNNLAQFPTATTIATTAISESLKPLPMVELNNKPTWTGIAFYSRLDGIFARNGSTTDAPTGKLVYPLATPQTYQLTPQEVLHTLYGVNNVWADTGNVSVTYPADTKMFIEKLTMPTEDDLVANQAITSGKYFMIGNSLYLALANIASGAQITIGTNAQRVSLADALNTINS